MDILRPRKTGKNFKVWGVRQSLIGDSIMALPILNYIEKSFPNSFKYWQIARKCSQSASLYFNHPLIDKIVISDCDEGMGPKDIEIAKTCDVFFNTMPPHPMEQDWPNYRNIYEETWVMAGLPLAEYHKMTPEEQRPKLYKWFNVEKRKPKTIAIWPCAGYGNENKRNPSKEWYNKLIEELNHNGYHVLIFGHPKDYSFREYLFLGSDYYFAVENHLPFFDQIKMTLGCDLVISTDSGSGLIFGAYEMPQISLLTNHFPNHTKNFTAFAPNNPNNHNIIGIGNPDKIQQDAVVKKVKELCP